jgi:hypothetical protein
VEARARIERQGVRREVLKLGERLEPRVAAAHEHEREELFLQLRVRGRVRELERLDHVVAKPDRVGQRLEPDSVLLEAGDGHDARDRPMGNEQSVVAKLLLATLLIANGNGPARGVASGDGAEYQAGLLEHVAQRRDDVARLEHPRRGLREKRRVEQEVDVVDERDARAVGGIVRSSCRAA